MTTQKIVPINVDRNVSFSDYKEFKESGKLLVSNMFYTYQGEGPFAGYPSVFLRLAGCNLGAKDDCPFCDTRFDFDKGVQWDIKELADELEKHADGKAGLLVVTGGEPMLQQEMLTKLFNELYARDSILENIQIETNGYFVKQDSFELCENDIYIVISPKVAATRGAYNKPKESWFNGIDSHAPNVTTFLKYVLTVDADSPYHGVPEVVLERCKGLNTRTILYVSGMAIYLKSYPENRISSIWQADEIDQLETAKNYRYTAQYALAHGLRVSFQSHLFGDVL